MRAEITEVMDGEILVEVIEAPHGNSGPFSVIITEKTNLYNAVGGKIRLSDLSAGDVVEITYGGQVMMSYPPRIAAISLLRR